MSTRRSKADMGVIGRPATAEERERLQRFVAEYERQANQRRADDADKLRALAAQYRINIQGTTEVAKPTNNVRLSRMATVRREHRQRMMLKTAKKGGAS